VAQACRIKDEKLDDIMAGKREPGEVIRPLRQLSDQIHSIDMAKSQLVRFCERLDDEHFEEFGSRIFSNLRREFPSYTSPRMKSVSNGRRNQRRETNNPPAGAA
jgi:hypothetical protein